MSVNRYDATNDRLIKIAGNLPAEASAMTGATSNTDGESGTVPQPLAGDQDKVLYGDGTWKDPGIDDKLSTYAADSTAWDTAPTSGSTNPVTSGGVAAAVTSVKTLVVTMSSISSLSTSVSNSNITSTMVVINSVLSNPSAQLGDWTVTTSNGSLTVAGSISGTTDITLYLAEAM